MGEDGKVIYKVVIDDNGVESSAEQAGNKAGAGVEKGARRGTGMFKEMMIGAARAIGEAFVQMAAKAVKGVEQIAKAGIEFNAKMETYRTAFTTLIGDADKAAAAIEQIRKDAASTPFDVDSLTAANQALLATGMDAERARKDVLNLANAIAATGGGSAELSRMAANMQQIRNTGKATAMDIRQFANAGINIYGILADSMGVTVEKAAEMDVTYEQLTKAFEKAASAGGAYAGAMEAQSQTFKGRISTLKDNVTQLAGALTEDLFSQLSNRGLPLVMGWVATLLEAAQTNGIKGAIEAAKTILSGLLDTFLDGLPQMLNTGLQLLTNLLTGITNSLPRVHEVIMQVLMALLQAILDNLPEIMEAGLQLLTALLNGIINNLPTIIPVVVQIMSIFIDRLMDYMPQLIMLGAKLLLAILYGLIQAWPDIWNTIKGFIRDIFTLWGYVDWGSIGQNLVYGIWNGIMSVWNAFVYNVRASIQNFVNEVKSWFGIHSPSTVFRYIGEMNMEGLEEGFEDKETELTNTVRHIYSGMLSTAAGGSDRSASDLERTISNNINVTGVAGGATIIVPLSIDGREVARATAWSMGEQLAWEEM